MPGLGTELVLRTPLVKRFAKGIPVVQLLLAAEVAVLAGQHVRLLDGGERRRLLTLLRKGRGRGSHLPAAEREELGALVAKLEPRRFAGAAAQRVSPVPLPRRLLFGRDEKRSRSA